MELVGMHSQEIIKFLCAYVSLDFYCYIVLCCDNWLWSGPMAGRFQVCCL
jgi:hypothetical protein